MRIVASTVQLDSAHLLEVKHSVSERLQVRVSPNPGAQCSKCDHFEPADSGGNRKLDRMLDKLGRLLEARQKHDSAPLDERIAKLTDRIKKLFDSQYGTTAAAAPAAPSVAGSTRVDVAYRRTETDREVEVTSFRATGSVVTSDGRQIDFSQALDLARTYARTETTSIQLSAVLAPGQTPATPASTDTTPTATASTPAAPVAKQALLVGGSAIGLDRNADGVIDPTTELLGTAGDGFAELAKLDTDQNGFVDEGDTAFSQLRLVDPGSTSPLADRGIGAIYTGSVATPYQYTGANGKVLGNLSATGIYLDESGTTGFVQQVNLVA